jgi:hypothetical protein
MQDGWLVATASDTAFSFFAPRGYMWNGLAQASRRGPIERIIARRVISGNRQAVCRLPSASVCQCQRKRGFPPPSCNTRTHAGAGHSAGGESAEADVTGAAGPTRPQRRSAAWPPGILCDGLFCSPARGSRVPVRPCRAQRPGGEREPGRKAMPPFVPSTALPACVARPYQCRVSTTTGGRWMGGGGLIVLARRYRTIHTRSRTDATVAAFVHDAAPGTRAGVRHPRTTAAFLCRRHGPWERCTSHCPDSGAVPRLEIPEEAGPRSEPDRLVRIYIWFIHALYERCISSQAAAGTLFFIF